VPRPAPDASSRPSVEEQIDKQWRKWDNIGEYHKNGMEAAIEGYYLVPGPAAFQRPDRYLDGFIYGGIGLFGGKLLTPDPEDLAGGGARTQGGREQKSPSTEAPGRPNAKTPKRMTPDQEALDKLAREAKIRGRTRPISPDEAGALRQWADEYGVPSTDVKAHPDRPIGKVPHIHIGGVDHIPVKPD
jgi:hypothetical protein